MYSLDAVITLIDKEGFPEDVKNILVEIAGKLLSKMNSLIGELNIEDSYLKEAITHILGRGKFIRGIFSYIVGSALGASEDDIIILAVSSELYHTASLIHDDIIDKATVRRGVETVHKKFGLERAIIAGDALIIYPNYLLARLGGEVIKTLAEAGLKLCDGEAQELLYTNDAENVDLHTYNNIVYKKTASFFEHIMKAVSIVSNKKELYDVLGRLGKYLGIAFQYRDDILDVIGDSQLMGKPTGSDVNKPNLVTILMRQYKISLNEALEKAHSLTSKYVANALEIIDILPISQRDSQLLTVLTKSLSKRVV